MTANRTITELYQALRPLLLRDVAIAASGSRASSGGMETHALSSPWHTGQLAESQAPWAATKNEWATALTTHAALPDVHHAAVTAGTLISLSGQQVSLANGSAQYQVPVTGASPFAPAWTALSGMAGDGLTFGSGAFAVGVSGLGLSVGANAVALESSSNPGEAASILASTAAGGLTLASLAVTGTATVGQDFTVGANVLYVNQAGTRVGINRTPDQQFDLDVAGAIRGQYLIGRHAIQLASAVGVWHYDGPAPYNLDFGGSDASHAGVGGTVTGGVIYVPGKFGKAVQVAEATTNLIPNPSFESNMTGWNAVAALPSELYNYATNVIGAYGAQLIFDGTTTAGMQTGVTLTNGASYTVSAYIWIASRTAGTIQFDVLHPNLATETDIFSLTAATPGWYRYTATFTSAGGGSAFVRIFTNNGFTGTIYVDAVQLEQKAYATPYCDGSLGTGHSWSGTAHASSSSRTAGSLSYAGDLISAPEGSLIFYADTGGDPNARMSIDCGSTTGVFFILDPSNNQEVYVGSLKFNLTTTIDDGWNHWALTWSESLDEIKLYQNGVQIGTTQTYTAPTPGATLTISGFYGLDELVILDYAADAKLIRAIYESDAPVFVESSVFHWRSPSASPIWVDEYGLWARSVTGNEILGVYGGDPRRVATYRSWGGVNLEDNDVLIGRAAGGYMHWDDSAQTLTVQGTITALAGSISGVLTIGTSGEIRQGTGTLGSDYTGLRIWRDSSIGRIGGYASNTLQWYAGTDGRFYAAGGVVSINQYGYMVATADFSSGGTWPFTFAGVHAVADVTAPTSNYRGSLMFGQPIGVFTDVPRVWHFHYPGTLAANTPTGGGASKEYAITISDDNESWSVWHTGNDGALAKIAGATFTGALRVSGDGGGASSSIGFSNVSDTSANSTGVGTILMKGATNRNSAGFIKIYIGTTAYYIPVFSAITG